MKFLIPLLLFFPVLGQTELYLPWVPQNATFQSTLILNNHQDETVQLQLKALRTFTTSQEVTVEIEPFGSMQVSAGELFSELGDGAGYVVSITSEANQITASCVVASTTTESGDSPSQMNAIPARKASPLLAYNYLPVSEDGFSAPVVVNVGTSPGLVTFHGFKDGLEIGTSIRNVLPGEVFARQTSEMFPDAEGGLYIVAESSQPLVGTSFIFNGLREPAMEAAEAISALPDPFSVLTALTIDPSRNLLRINDPREMVVSGTYLQGPSQILTSDVEWSSSNTNIVSISNGGADKGTVLAKQQGTAVITATLGDVSDQLAVEVLPPRLNLEWGIFCINSPPECSRWDQLSIPARFTVGAGAFFTGQATQVLESFRISSSEGPFTISQILVEDLTGNVPAKVSGLEVGQTIQTDQIVNFSLEAGRTNGELHQIQYQIGVEGRGIIFAFTLSYRSN